MRREGSLSTPVAPGVRVMRILGVVGESAGGTGVQGGRSVVSSGREVWDSTSSSRRR